VLTADTDFDLTVVKSTAAEWSSSGITGLDFSNLFPDTGWTPVVAINNYSGTKSVNLDSASITLIQNTGVVEFSVSYAKALAGLGMVDPGTWTLYATKTISGVENIVELATGNLQIKMYS
jgi:hypothetical protein